MAHIVMSNKDSLDSNKIGPISLLNIDIKILTKNLATRFNTFLRDLIHRDQVGFVPHRQYSDNTRKVIHLIHLVHKNQIPGMVLGLNIYKAFDSLSWDYLYCTMS